MNSEKISTIAIEPFIREFTFQIIKIIGLKNYPIQEKNVINADLIPKLSHHLRQRQQIKNSLQIIPSSINNQKIIQKQISKQIQKKPLDQRYQRQMRRAFIPQRNIIPPPVQLPHSLINEVVVSPQEYGKIAQLINDPSVQQIECPGAGKQILVLRLGQKQITRITLSVAEISELIETISNKAHIPLLNGVFRAAVDHLLVSAVVSEMIGTRFVIKKQLS
jgi:hypothetical protein